MSCTMSASAYLAKRLLELDLQAAFAVVRACQGTSAVLALTTRGFGSATFSNETQASRT